MKIAISSTGETLSSKVDPRFGRAPFFIVVETEENVSRQVSAFPNKAADAATGAGTEAAQQVIQAGVRAIITGAVGPHAYEIFEKMGIEIFLIQGEATAEEALKKLKDGALQKMTIRRL